MSAIFKMAAKTRYKKWAVKIQHCPISSKFDICGIVASILKMVTGRNFSMSGINSGHHYLPTYQILLISDNVEFLRYCGGHFENGDR
jgi:hypothetical protein